MIQTPPAHIRLGLLKLCALNTGTGVAMASENKGRIAAGVAALKPHEKLCANCALIIGGALNLGPMQ